jgi:NAD(P)-dependent dehydrogenase (short-subunit alcohol dehydrogenase family)
MLLSGKAAAVFAATGAIGEQVARSFAQQGAHVFVSGRRLDAVQAAAQRIREAGGRAEAHQVDAMDERAVESHLAEVIERAGRLDVVLNAIGVRVEEGDYGVPATDLSFERFMLPITRHLGSQFLTARAAARHMLPRGSGVILTLSASLTASARPFMSGVTAACAGIESLTRSLAAELGPAGVRVICLRPGALLTTRTIQETLVRNARAAGVPLEAFTGMITQASLMRRGPSLEEVGALAAALASDATAAMTGETVSVMC